ncbi:cytoskeletal protein RodZ [Sphingobium sp. OAS761]|uniref:helix-turn-helix domain-containing protein n=1 Tax=Sphingobium sp. OAS761 TaxID=2817901 RepID=UPI0020A16D1E|nr:helix-turn-helix domain-containing protein [Sphingobium sp. OAS761]MCP1468794.1 cytoskeletal protein RodZ [Sphingobium sp. OAS761]
MTDEAEQQTGADSAPEVQANSPGAKLRVAREAQGLSVQDIATRTRIAQRQLEAIERDDYAALPGIPYAVGFARAYARSIGVDEVMIAAEVRQAVNGTDLAANRYEAFEPADPARVPPRRLAWAVAAIVLLLIAGYTLWRTQLFTPPPGADVGGQEEQAQSAAVVPAAAPVPAAVQPVLFTATDDVWLRIYDETGERLKDGIMKKGESYTLPSNARNPMILTGRPQALAVTVGGKPVAPLGAADRTIADVPVSAAALLARGTPAANQTVAPSPARSAAPAPRPAPRRVRPAVTVPEPALSSAPAPAPAPAAAVPAPAPSAADGTSAQP